jgi:ATP-binding cassette subfamily B protein IrtA
LKEQSDLKRLMGYAGKYRYLSYASWVLSALSAFIMLVPYWYIWKVMKEVLDNQGNMANASGLTHNGAMAVIFAILGVLIYIAGLMCSHIAAFRIAANLRIKTMEHIVMLPSGAAESFGSGRLRKIVNESSAATETYLAHQLPDRAGAIATPIGLLLMLFIFDIRLGLLSLMPVVLGFVIMMTMTGQRMQQKMKEYQNALDDMSNEAVEYVRGIPVVKTFGQTIFSFRKFKSSIDRYEKWVIAYTKELRMPMVFYTAAVNGVFVFLTAGALLFFKGTGDSTFITDLIFYVIITPIISVTLTKIMFMSENAMIVNDALKRIDSIFAMESLKEAKMPSEPMDSSVELKNVSFSYDGKNNVINDISLSIAPGETVAFVGPSGGGKSTLAGLISRFFDVKAGGIFIGGVNVKNIPKKKLMNTVSFIFQDSRLIKASIFENVRLGKPDAGKDEIMDALKNAQCMDIIEKLPMGMDTVIGTKGVYLSGGEQQRIAIARAMLKNAPVIIMDEATAFADPDNEMKVQEAFSRLAVGKTVIMIAHRLTTVAGADRIFVIKDGSIAESGSWSELMKKNGLFKEMWDDYGSSVKWRV